MKKGRRINRWTYFGAALLMPLYLLIVTAHLFFTPKFQDGLKRYQSSFVKSDSQSIYYLIRNDRSTYSENKQLKVTPKAQSFDSVPALAFSNILHKSERVNPHPYKYLPIHRHVWLTKRVLRIWYWPCKFYLLKSYKIYKTAAFVSWEPIITGMIEPELTIDRYAPLLNENFISKYWMYFNHYILKKPIYDSYLV